MLAVFKREFKSYFTNPLGFIILAVVYFFLGYMFSSYYSAGAPYVQYVVIAVAQILLFVIPVITMRLFSDEHRQKTDQVLFTAPVKLINIVLGKFFAAFALYAIGFAPTIVYQIIVSSYVSVNLFYYIYSIVGILLFGAALIALGMFISSLTESPIISIVFTLIVNIFIMLASSFANAITVPTVSSSNAIMKFLGTIWAWLVKAFASFINGFDFIGTLESFGNQTFAVKDVIFFISVACAFIFLTERSLEKRRWS